ncbi:putative helicase [Tetrabaena socialis]|uniref:Putative helicase n=1 Tax=Tetrabaena socialis TaxID=47790 RepID=A0A2J8A1S7_9CHLO|nr:putative helicase [Tetrabaena socialis]|eukprot:PNH06464.1 putative helicase [Tetrabaena socialis]
MSGMRREVRACLGSELYHDVDMVNSQPTLCLQYFSARSLPTTYLGEYVRDRASRLREVQEAMRVDREAAKGLFLRLMFGGSPRSWCTEYGRLDEADQLPAFVRAYQRELHANMAAVLKLPENAAYLDHARARASGRATANWTHHHLQASAFSYLCQDLERRCLDALRAAVAAEGWTVGSLIHDGLMVRRRRDRTQEPLDAAVLRVWEAAINTSTGFSVLLAEKPMEIVAAYLNSSSSSRDQVHDVEVAVPEPEQAMVTVADVVTVTRSVLGALEMGDHEVKRAFLGGLERTVLHLDVVASSSMNREEDEDEEEEVSDSARPTRVTLDLLSLALTLDGIEKGYLHGAPPRGLEVVDCDLGSVHPSFVAGMKWVTTRPSTESVTFISNGSMRAQIDVLNFTKPADRSAKVNLPDMNKRGTVMSARKLDTLMGAYTGSIQHALSHALGLGGVMVTINNVNCQNLTINGGGDAESSSQQQQRSTDDDLIVSLLGAHPGMRERWRFSPDAKSESCNGMYHCDPATHVWRQVHNAFVEDALVYLFKSAPLWASLTKEDRRYVGGRRGSSEMRCMLARKVLHEGFTHLLDENPDVFAVANGLFDMRRGGEFRPVRPEDMVMTHATWSYDGTLAAAKRPAVEAFLRQVLPVDAERRVVLSYFAGLLSGHRDMKKFLVLTDRRAGDNGKTTFAQLMSRFFSSYAVPRGTKFVCKGSFDKDRDSHDAGLAGCRGKRLMVAEELKGHMTLDVAMLKAYTGGRGSEVEGRACGSASTFRYIWQSGFVLIFNEGDAPKFDAQDQAFLGRMVVVPMRSKFVPLDARGRHPELDDEFVFPMNKELSSEFPSWCPALAEILMECRDSGGLDAIPESMREWRTDIADAGNTLAEWFADRVAITGSPRDAVPIRELWDLYRSHCDLEQGDNSRVSQREFKELALAFFRTKRDAGVVVKDKAAIKQEDGGFLSVRWVVLGIVISR